MLVTAVVSRYTICPPFSVFIDSPLGVSLAAPLPPPSLLLLALLGVLVCKAQPSLFHLGPVPPRHETIRRFDVPRCQLPVCLAVVGRSAVSSPNNKAEVPLIPLFGSTHRDVAHVCRGRPGSGFSPPFVAPNITRRVSRSGFARCMPPANRRRRLRILVSALSHCAFSRTLAYDLRWSARCG